MSTKTTKFGWPVPNADGSDPIPALANIINQLGNAIDGAMFLANDVHKAADMPNTYPQGITIMGVAGGNGWIEPDQAATVVSIRRGDGTRTYQLYFVSGSTSSYGIFYRFGTASGWLTDWLFVTSRHAVQAQASGQVTISGNAGVRSAVVMFPNGRFSSAPRVIVSNNATIHPDAQSCSCDSVSASQMTVYVNRTDGQAASVAWLATEGLE